MTEDQPPDTGTRVQGPPEPISTPASKAVPKVDEQTIQLGKDLRTGERWIIVINGAGVILSVIIAMIYWGQLKEMRKATRASASSAYAACENAQIARSTLLEIQSGRTDAHGVAVSSIYQGIAATQSQSAALTPFIDPLNLRVNENIAFSSRFQNTGRTAAKNVQFSARVVFLGRYEDPDFSYPPLQTAHMSIGRMYSGGSSYAGDRSLQPSISVLNKDGSVVKAEAKDLSDFNEGKKDVIAYGTIEYSDIFGVKHWTRFCTVNQKFTDVGTIKDSGHPKCAAYNRDDTNQAVSYNTNPNTPSPTALPEIDCVKPKETE
jgi:hypothetical protein